MCVCACVRVSVWTGNGQQRGGNSPQPVVFPAWERAQLLLTNSLLQLIHSIDHHQKEAHFS